MKSVYVFIPYELSILNSENTYQAVFASYLYVFKANILLEDSTNKGRIDAVLKTKNYIYIIEFKLNQSSDLAIRQIIKKYHEKYLDDGREIHLLGINFSTKERNIKDWKLEKIGKN